MDALIYIYSIGGFGEVPGNCKRDLYRTIDPDISIPGGISVGTSLKEDMYIYTYV